MRNPVEIDSDDDGPVIARAAAIDVAKATGMICTRVPHASKPDRKVTKVGRPTRPRPRSSSWPVT